MLGIRIAISTVKEETGMAKHWCRILGWKSYLGLSFPDNPIRCIENMFIKRTGKDDFPMLEMLPHPVSNLPSNV